MQIHVCLLFKHLVILDMHLLTECCLFNYRHYVKDKRGRIINAPYVDLSYKWAGGGLLSNVRDIVRFGNIMLYSHHCRNYSSGGQKVNKVKEQDKMEEGKNCDEIIPKLGYLKSDTVKMLWTPAATMQNRVMKYGMGWEIIPGIHEHEFCQNQQFHAVHTGGAIGGSSVLLIRPLEKTKDGKNQEVKVDTQGHCSCNNCEYDRNRSH